jgi:hypothetical protein
MAMCFKGTNRMFEEEKPILGNESSPQQIATFKNTIIPQLTKLGVSKLTVNYSGSGDEGSIDDIDVQPEGIAIPRELEAQICDLTDDFLYCEHGSWGDGDGCPISVTVKWLARGVWRTVP